VTASTGIAYGIKVDLTLEDVRAADDPPSGLKFYGAGDSFTGEYKFALIISNTLRETDDIGWTRTHLEFPSEHMRKFLVESAVEMGLATRETVRPGWLLGIGWG
jgi:hypothetical protein